MAALFRGAANLVAVRTAAGAKMRASGTAGEPARAMGIIWHACTRIPPGPAAPPRVSRGGDLRRDCLADHPDRRGDLSVAAVSRVACAHPGGTGAGGLSVRAGAGVGVPGAW